MRWYWWVLTVILALNAFVIVAVALFMVYDRVRNQSVSSNEKRKGTGSDEKHQRT